ncbi:MAG TPA: hypothetical protein VKR54_02805 [Candidatus Babeliales bacterium]|jgi:hypothetical protein|nr:hypothetical protein [Candidatus Babeliales bacterium]
MTISKKLLLLATLSLTLGSQLGASDYQTKQQNIFNFALTLKQQNNEQAQIAANWLEEKLFYSNGGWYFNTDAVTVILNAHLTPAEKIAYILKLKTKEEELKIEQEEKEKEFRKKVAKEHREYDNRLKKEETKKIMVAGLCGIAACITIPALCIFSELAGRKIALAILGA